MTFDKFYPVVRTILGDEEIHGIWNYNDDRLDSAIKSVFLLGRGPKGYLLNDAQTDINPDPPSGDPYALISYEASLLLVFGEDGEVRMRTRSVWLIDKGERKRDLLIELGQLIYEIRDGGAVFATYQNLEDFLNSMRSGSPGFPIKFSEINVTTAPPEITI